MNTITIQQIGILVIRCIALLMLLEIISYAGAVINGLVNLEGSVLAKVISIFPYTILLIFCVVLWKRAAFIAQKMVPETTAVSVPFTIENIQIVLLVPLGVFIFIIKAFEPTIMAPVNVSSLLQGDEQAVFKLIEALFYLTSSLLLIFKPLSIVRLIGYAREDRSET